ncbi:GTP pyrophosphokinase [Vibrio mimicus]|uniref:GTP pyrophosphokinase n=1 Tax=Vibrio mimicus TaxID=674 RepID=UPI0018C89453|nr:RelA/SpoT domain-containing protein [Vibrio mimicus]
MYKAWGDLVVSELCQKLEELGRDLGVHLKQPAKVRIKSDDSLIDKAFYRPNKNYENPYDDIEDKVGCRFVVLLVEHIDELSKIIKSSKRWEYIECRHFCEERKREPLLFTYQSVHYVVRARTDEQVNGETVKTGTPCEIQIRTLLQHAYAELTHDAVYKAKRVVKPEVHRTVAKSMALIETTDDFFSDVNCTNSDLI